MARSPARPVDDEGVGALLEREALLGKRLGAVVDRFVEHLAAALQVLELPAHVEHGTLVADRLDVEEDRLAPSGVEREHIQLPRLCDLARALPRLAGLHDVPEREGELLQGPRARGRKRYVPVTPSVPYTVNTYVPSSSVKPSSSNGSAQSKSGSSKTSVPRSACSSFHLMPRGGHSPSIGWTSRKICSPAPASSANTSISPGSAISPAPSDGSPGDTTSSSSITNAPAGVDDGGFRPLWSTAPRPWSQDRPRRPSCPER